MRRGIVLTTTSLLAGCALVAASAASAAPAKKKAVKVKKTGGTYTASAVPDPTMEGTGEAGMHCFNVNPASVDNHPLSLPGTGMLQVILSSPDPTTSHLDWDLYLLDAKGAVIGSSDGGTAQEEIDQPGAKGKVTIRACNLIGEPTATVKWTFTYH